MQLHLFAAPRVESAKPPRVRRGIPDEIREQFDPLPARRCGCRHPQFWKDDDGRLRCGACGREPR